MMEASNVLDDFLGDLFGFLVGRATNSISDLKMFRKHNNKLDSAGDVSFPLNINGWLKFLMPGNKSNIVKYIENKTMDFHELINESKRWTSLKIHRVKVVDNKVCLFLNRSETFKKITKMIFEASDKYGMVNLNFTAVKITTDVDNSNLSDLTNLRIDLIKKVTVNVLKYCGCKIDEGETICLTNKSNDCDNKKIVCGVVITNKFGKKNTNIPTEDFYRKRTVDMQLMAQHKYGVRVNSEPGWVDFFQKLGNAAVIIDLLHVKPSRPMIINEDCATSTCGKGAAFILYNCARLSEIFKKFDTKVSKGEYPKLPEIDSVDFSLLNQHEEWELLYVYLIQYPSVINSCVSEILECKLHTYNIILFLDTLCSTFSIYYRRVRVLTEARMHLMPVMHSRICLLKAIQQVLHNALALLDISPVKQM